MNLDFSERFIRKYFPSYNEEAKNFQLKCPECDVELNVPDDMISGEIISCPDCGMDFEVRLLDNGEVELKTAEIEGEDWGE